MPEECPQLGHDFGGFSWPNFTRSPVRPRFGPFFVAEHVPRPGAAQAMIRLAKADLNGTRTYDLKSKL